jgi:hypothetical protein
LLPEIKAIAWQVINYNKIFEIGFLLQIHGKIIISPEDHDMKALGCGSFEETCCQNGKHLVRVRFYGSMANVSFCTHVHFYRG